MITVVDPAEMTTPAATSAATPAATGDPSAAAPDTTADTTGSTDLTAGSQPAAVELPSAPTVTPSGPQAGSEFCAAVAEATHASNVATAVRALPAPTAGQTRAAFDEMLRWQGDAFDLAPAAAGSWATLGAHLVQTTSDALAKVDYDLTRLLGDTDYAAAVAATETPAAAAAFTQFSAYVTSQCGIDIGDDS